MPDFGQWGALAVDTSPLDLVTPKMNAVKLGLAQSQLARAPVEQAQAESNLARSGLELEQLKLASAATKAAYYDQIVGDLWHRSYDNETLNANIEQAKKALGPDGGTYGPALDQFKDKFSVGTQRAMLAIHGGAGRLGARAGSGGATGGGAAQSGLGGSPSQAGIGADDLDARYEGQTPEKMAETLRHLDTLKQVLPTIHDQTSLNLAIDKIKADMPDAERFRGSWTDARAGNEMLGQLYDMIDENEPYLRKRLAGSAAGTPSPITTKMDKFGDMGIVHDAHGNVVNYFGALKAGEKFLPSAAAAEADAGGTKIAGSTVQPTGQVTPKPEGPIYDQVSKIATEAAGGDTRWGNLAARTAQLESGGRMKDAKGKLVMNNSSTGLFQFQDKTFKGAGGKDITSVEDQTQTFVRHAQANERILRTAGFEQPSDADLYIMHQQGPGGGKALLTAPGDASAVGVLTPVYGSEARATDAIAGNIGMPFKTPEQKAKARAAAKNLSAFDFTSLWDNKWTDGKSATQVQVQTPDGQSVPFHVIHNDEGLIDDDTANTMAGMVAAGINPAQAGLSFGNGAIAGMNKAKIAKAFEMMVKATGEAGPDLAVRFANLKASKVALDKLAPAASQTEQYASLVDKNIATARGIVKDLKLSPDGMPIVLKAWREGKKTLGGDPGIARLFYQLDIIAAENAKLQTGGERSAMAGSDSARKEQREHLPGGATANQLNGLFDLIETDKNNRVSAVEEQLTKHRAIIQNKGRIPTEQPTGGGSAPAPGHVAALKKNPKLAADFDRMYGSGSAQRVLGGAP